MLGEKAISLHRQKQALMKTRNEYIELLRAHAAELHQKFGITYMRLFGSVAAGCNHEGSDVDLLVDMPASYHNTCDAAEYIENLLECEVDLIRRQSNLQPSFLEMINKYGIDIFPAA